MRLAADRVWYAYEGVASFLSALVFTVTAVYFVTELGMSPLQLVVVGTVMELAVFVFEVPTGIVADTYSRRLSIVIGNVVMGLGFVLVGGVEAVWGGCWQATQSGASVGRSRAGPWTPGSPTRRGSSA